MTGFNCSDIITLEIIAFAFQPKNHSAMIQKNITTLLLPALLYFLLTALPNSSNAADPVKMPLPEKVIQATAEEKTTLINLYSWATILPKELIDLQNRIAKEKRINTIHEEIPEIAEEIDKINWDTIAAQTNPNLQIMQVGNLQNRTLKVISHLKSLIDPIDENISYWSESRKDWLNKKDKIENIDKDDVIPLLLGSEQHERLINTVDEAISIIDDHLRIVLILGKEIGDMQISLYSIEGKLQSLDEDIKEISIQQTAPSMLSGEFYSRINLKIFIESYNQTKSFFLGRVKSMQENRHWVLLASAGFIITCFIIYRSYTIIRLESPWIPFSKRPVATTIFMASCINAFATVLPLKTDLPEQWDALLMVITLFAVTGITKHLIDDKERRSLLNKLSFFMIGAILILLTGLPQIVLLLYVFYVSVVTFLYYVVKLPSTKGKEIKEVWRQRVWGLCPAIVIISVLTGYDQFAIMMFSIFISSVIGCLVVYVLFRFTLGFIDVVLTLIPMHLVKENHEEILNSIHPIVKWLHVFILLIILSVIWDIYPNINKAFRGINDFGFNIGELYISLQFIFTVALVLYGALLSSRAVQALLLKDILPRYKAEKGVQASVTRLAHYAILTCGFLIMLRVLGFQLNQLTLLGGALGVGVGFGLQAIVNNFASGLILLFERPIKVGDTIQIGEEWGEVKSLGLRATVIQTFDNAEIVVPNSDLITGQVTNWTLGDRKVRVRVPVGVAYGTDVSQVMEILTSCGNANPMVLSDPKPVALFLAFGASSLDFELRVWIPEFLDKLQVLSELNQDIDNEFSMNGIEIPFPQSDLHLRSVDEAAAASFGNISDMTNLPVSRETKS